MVSSVRTSLGRSFCIIFIILLSCIGPSLEQDWVKLFFPSTMTSTTISISWFTTAGASFEYYTVDVAPPSGTSVNGYPATTSDTAYTCTGLRPNTLYTITVTPWAGMGSGDPYDVDLSTDGLSDREIFVTDITSDSAYVQWKNYSSPPYSIVTSPTGAVDDVGDISEPEVILVILMPETMINVMVKHNGNVLASGNFTSGSSPDECGPPERCNSASALIEHSSFLVVNLIFFIVYVTMLQLP